VYYLREDFVVRCLRSWTVDCVLPERGLCCEVFAELDCGPCIT